MGSKCELPKSRVPPAPEKPHNPRKEETAPRGSVGRIPVPLEVITPATLLAKGIELMLLDDVGGKTI
jgi:hypothetical protein